MKSHSMTQTDNSITGSIASVGTYLLSITQINAYASLFLGLLSGISSIYTIINIYESKKKKNEKS
jgi:Kef-type K+ transport system membrane component KefB